MGGGPGGGMGGGMGGGGFGSMATSNNMRNAMNNNAAASRKYSLSFTVDANNVFNIINYGTPGGTITPTQDPVTGDWSPGTQFGHSLSLAGGMFGGGNSAARRISFQASFSF